MKEFRALKKPLMKSKGLIWILCIALLVADFPTGVSRAEGSITTKTETAVSSVTEPEVYPTPVPTSAPELTSKTAEVSASALASRSSLTSTVSDEVYTEEESIVETGSASIWDDAEVRELALQYIEAFGSGETAEKTPYLSVEQVKTLSSSGAYYADIYAIAFLQDLLTLSPEALWAQKQDSALSWLELEAKLQGSSVSATEQIDVTEDVYGSEETSGLTHSLTAMKSLSVSQVVYSESTSSVAAEELLSTLAISTLSATVNSVIDADSMKMINETFKEQYSDHYGMSESVDPTSGSLTWKDNQISLSGRDGLDLNIGIMYNSNQASTTTPTTAGSGTGKANLTEDYNVYDARNNLGAGWAFRFPSMSPGAVYYDGEGGAYDVNDTGNKITANIKEGVLKDYQKGDLKIYTYLNADDSPKNYYSQYADGKKEYFNSKGQLYKITDRFGNEINFTYKTLTFQGRYNTETRYLMETITDSMGRYIQFTYDNATSDFPEGSVVKVTVKESASASQASQTVTYTKGSNHSLTKIEQGDQTVAFTYTAGRAKFHFYWKTFEYSTYSPYGEVYYSLLNKVTYNNTSETTYNYEVATHNMNKAGQMETYRVNERFDGLKKSSGTSTKLNWNTYAYTGDYSGYGVTADPDVLPADYHFTSMMTSLNQSGTAQNYTTTSFNNQKQMESVETKILSGSQSGQRQTTLYSGFLTTYKYTPTVIEERTYSSDSDAAPNQLYTDLTYDSMGYVSTQTAPLTAAQRDSASTKSKYTTNYGYDGIYHFVSSKAWYQNESDAAAASASYAYNSQGRLLTATNALGETISYTYESASDGSGKLYKVTATTTSGGKVVSKTVTTYGAEASYAYPTQTESYSNIGLATQQIVTKKMTYNLATGGLLSESDGSGHTTSYTYDDLGRLLKVTTPKFTNSNGVQYSETEEYKYTNNQVSTNFDATNSGTFSFVVNTVHTLTQLSDNSAVTTYGIVFYNGLGQALLEERWDENQGKYTQTQYHYDEWNRAVYAIDAAGNTQSVSYDGWGQANSSTDTFGNQMVATIDRKQRKTISYLVAAGTGEQLNYAEQSYDQWGNVITTKTYRDWPSQTLPISETYRYDLLGNVTAYTDPKNNLNADGVTTSYRYDALGRLTAVKDALNQTTSYTYDGNGQLTSTSVQASGGTPQVISSKTYNELGQLTVKTDASSQSETLQYNSLGLLSGMTDRNGTVSSYQYDEQNQLTSTILNGTVGGTEQTQKIQSIFGGNGVRTRVTKIVTNNVETASQSITLDSLGRTRSRQATVGTHNESIQNSIDIIDRTTQIGDVNQSFYTNYQYNKTQLNKVQTNGSATLSTADSTNVQYAYTPGGLVQSITYPTLTDGSVLKTEYTYNKALNWVESITNKKGSTVLSKYTYGYDNNGNITSVVETLSSGSTQTTTYGYDALNRLTSAVHPGGGTDSYTYDVRGNRLTMEQSISNTAAIEDTSYTYDLQNTLISLTKGSTTTSFSYYADGLRDKKVTGSSQTLYSYNFSGQVITEEKSSGQKANYVRGDRVLVKKDKTASKDYYYLYNGHGDVVQIVDTSGAIVNSYAYDEWGNITSQTEGISNPFKYTGEIYDEETGLYYLRARYYDPSTGRFLNEDTYEGQIDNPLSQNLYTYVENNPLGYMDPSGHMSEPYEVHELRYVLNDAIDKNLNKGSELYQAYHDKIWERYGFASILDTNQYNYLFGLLTGTSAYENSAGKADWALGELINAFYEAKQAEYVATLSLGMAGRLGGGSFQWTGKNFSQMSKSMSPNEMISNLEKLGWTKTVEAGGKKSGPATILTDPRTGTKVRIHAEPGEGTPYFRVQNKGGGYLDDNGVFPSNATKQELRDSTHFYFDK